MNPAKKPGTPGKTGTAIRRLAMHWPVLAALVAAEACADEPMTRLAPFSASYEVSLNNLPFKAAARQSLVPLGGDRWRLELRVESFLLDTVETSEFRWDGARCHTIPERYAYTRKGVGRNRSLEMRFDFSRGQASRNDGKSTTTFAITPDVEDKLGHTLALSCRVARGARGVLGVDLAWDHDVRHFDYRTGTAEEAVKTPLGSYRALRLERVRADSDRITSTWLSSATGWQSVQMQHTEGDGKLFRLRLLELEHAPSP